MKSLASARTTQAITPAGQLLLTALPAAVPTEITARQEITLTLPLRTP